MDTNEYESKRVVSYDPYAGRRDTGDRLVQAVWLVFGIIEGLIAIRFVLRLLGANPGAPFADFIYDVTAVLVAPFVGMFGTPQLGASAFEPHSVVALIVYALLGWTLAKVVWLAAGETRTATTTTAQTVERKESDI